MKAAIIGFGNIAQEHAKGYAVANGASLVAVADASPDRLTLLRDSGVRTFSVVSTMLAEINPDVVSICTPPSTHAALAELALGHGAHVFCEKPLAHNTTDARRMIEAAASANRLLGVAFCHRFIPAIRRLKDLIETGAIGTPLLYRNQFSGPFEGVEKTWFSNPELSGGGTLMDTTVHSIDLFRYLVGEPESVRGLASTTRSGLQVEDTSVVLLRSGKCLGTLEASWTVAPGTLLIEVRGKAGEIVYDYEILRWRGSEGGAWTNENVEAGIDGRFQAEIQHFVDAIHGKVQLELRAIEGLRASEILEQAYADLRR